MNKNFHRFKQGQESGFNYLYTNLYKTYFWQGMRVVKDDVIANCLAQDAFLKLWLLRNQMEDLQTAMSFLRKQVKSGYTAYFLKSSSRFHRSLLKLDDLENYQQFMLGYEPSLEEDDDDSLISTEGLEAEQLDQLAKVLAAVPNLPDNQQLFIKLCLKYAFSYDRIAYYLGGISDYEVARTVEKSIQALKMIITGAQKLKAVTAKAKPLVFQGDLSKEQLEILSMRYELQYSFEEIAKSLNLSQTYIQQQFVQAYAVIKPAGAGKYKKRVTPRVVTATSSIVPVPLQQAI